MYIYVCRYVYTSNLISQASSHGNNTNTASTVEQEDGPSSSTSTVQDADLSGTLPKVAS